MHKDLASQGWALTVAMLGHGGLPEDLRPTRRRSAERSADGAAVDAAGASGSSDVLTLLRPPPTIHVLDRPTPRTAAVSWSDPGACHYGYQIWDMAPAKRTGTCVLSGCAIRIGDTVYSPRDEDPSPINAGAMIAAAFVDA